MYLKRIVAHGFKSFADKMNIEFTDGISGIVGPNGSGKSNVVDAVRWVLGEQSVKSLRGDGTMTDVIFSGSHSRKASNMASITLVFDNQDHYLPVDFTEVAIKRQVYKDGTQEYYFNGEKCRLKDITNLLLDTGIAKESFNIISQGRVDEMISSKPSERRVIFEEAAGVLKYKKRKEDALRKLERTHENMDRVEDIINELEVQVEPLLKQRDQALQYQEKQAMLERIEVALITHDITSMNAAYQLEKEKIQSLNEEILHLTSLNTNSEAVISKYKLSISKRQEQLNQLSKQLLDKTSEVAKINGQKQIILERKKYQVADVKLHQNIVQLKEEQLQLANDLDKMKRTLVALEEERETLQSQIVLEQNQLTNGKQKREALEQKLHQILRQDMVLDQTIANLRDAIDHHSTLPNAVKQVLQNPKLTGIHDAIGNLIEVEERYSKAISIALGGASSYVVVDQKEHAEDAIRYLKEQKLGRATFLPIPIIKGRYLDAATYETVKSVPGFVDVASNLVKTNPIYHQIIHHHLGNILVVDKLDTASRLSQMIRHTRKIVTLDGDVVNIGGSLTGGSTRHMRSVIQDKYDLEHALQKQARLVGDRQSLEDQMNQLDFELKGMEDKLYLLQKEDQLKRDTHSRHQQQIKELEERQEQVNSEIQGTNHLLTNSLGAEEEAILELFYQTTNLKNQLEEQIAVCTKEKDALTLELDEYEFRLRRENSAVNSKNKELKALEIAVGRKDVKLDHLLNTLNESYNITYERALTAYPLELEVEEARMKVGTLKRDIRELGVVNLGAIEEYDRIRGRYDFLLQQREDLTKAEDTLLEIIQEMDTVMEQEFKTTFDIINEHFAATFRELFHGGTGALTLTDPDHLLETGIEIVASPPGKKLSSISLLSGGEKTFTAISLLFAILKSRPVPFCILDEVEAALDEVNVDRFGEYLTKMKKTTQFILITHKKKTMEYADVLYGITMQESGVSKLVSVKLDEIAE
ncbi:MAG: chromosome segregation protein SMC [Bacilli bacterium]|nr:chromosome segregation protein SMC [Bacilli bacterium]